MRAGVRFGWGVAGAEWLAPDASAIVVVDVLSFTTSVSIATSRGIAVTPCPDDESGRALVASHGGALAVNRRQARAEHPYSLSPAHLASAPLPPDNLLVLPSPNGSRIAALAATHGLTVVAASLRNAGASAEWLIQAGLATADRVVGVIAAGERWPDGSLRPAIEDLLGAACVIDHLANGGCTLDGQAATTRRAVEAVQEAELADLVRDSQSGAELISLGFAEDVELAVALGADTAAAVMAPRYRGFVSQRPGDL